MGNNLLYFKGARKERLSPTLSNMLGDFVITQKELPLFIAKIFLLL